MAGQLGLEPTPDLFVARMVEVFREVWRVLRSDGVCFVNLGDSYANQAGERTRSQSGECERPCAVATNLPARSLAGLKPKDLCGIPWRVALALQADGWWLRSDIIWAKPNPMPESVTDRPTKSHEYVFLLTKSERYYWDAEAVREANLTESNLRDKRSEAFGSLARLTPNGKGEHEWNNPFVRNIRTVWTIATESYPGAHFATYPRKLVEPCVKAGTSEKGCCPECGKGWERETEKKFVSLNSKRPNMTGQDNMQGWKGTTNGHTHVSTTGWHPSCQCRDPIDDCVIPPVPCIVFDPFAGSGTTGVVALALKRRFIGLDLSAEYLALAQDRVHRPHKPIQRPGKPEHHPLFGGLE